MCDDHDRAAADLPAGPGPGWLALAAASVPLSERERFAALAAAALERDDQPGGGGLREPVLAHTARPCTGCPWVVAQTGRMAYPNLAEYVGGTCTPADQPPPPLGADMFACHMAGTTPSRLCAGWLAVEGARHGTVMLALAGRHLPAAAVRPGGDWPELFASASEMIDAVGFTPAAEQLKPPQLARRKRPCEECPWRTDVAPGQFSAARFERLRRTSVGPEEYGGAVPPEMPMFGCHKGAPGTGGSQDLACAGWLAVAGRDHLTVRMAIREGALPVEALEPGRGWPPLYDTYDDMAAAMGDPDLPDTCTTDTDGDDI